MKLNELNEKDMELIRQVKSALDNSYDKQRHMVGAAVRCQDGAVFTGVNCRCIHGSCAEFIAVGAAATAGNKELETIVAMQRKDGIDHILRQLPADAVRLLPHGRGNPKRQTI